MEDKYVCFHSKHKNGTNVKFTHSEPYIKQKNATIAHATKVIDRHYLKKYYYQMAGNKLKPTSKRTGFNTAAGAAQ